MKLSITLFSLVAAEGSGSTPNRDPKKRVDRIEMKFTEMMNLNFAENLPGWTASVITRWTRMGIRAKADFTKRNSKCDLWEDPDAMEIIEELEDEIEQR
jgi:hypothetical protein